MRKSTLQRFFAVYLLDLRLTCLHWSYLLFLALWSGFVFVTYTKDDYANLFGLFNFVLGFSSLIAMFLAGLQASRVTRSRFDRLEVALPTGVEVFLARWLASITAVLGLLIAPLVVAVLAPPGRLDAGIVLRMVGLTVLSAAFVTGLIWLLQNTVGIRRWMYPLFAVLWVAGGMIPVMLSNDGLPLPGVNLLNFITMNQFEDSMWGSLPQGQLPMWFVLFYVGIVALFVGVMIWRAVAARFYRRSLPAILLTIIALGVVVFTGVGYSAQVYAGNQQVIDQEKQNEAALEQVMLPAEMPFAVIAYDVTFALGTPSRLSVVLEVKNRSDAPLTELVFSLYEQFDVTDANESFTRENDSLTLTLAQALPPGETTQISLTYEGNIQFFERRLGRPAEATYFIDPDGVNLACQVLWYPIPGRLLPNFTFYDEAFAAHPHCPLDRPARFRLTMSEAGSLQYTSNLAQVDGTTFESDGTIWVQLVGTPGLETVADDDLTVVAMSNQMDKVRSQVEQFYPPAFQYLQQFFPQAEHLTVMALDVAGDSFSQWETYPSTTESVLVIVEPRVFAWLPLNQQNEYDYVGAPIVKSIFGQDTSLTENIAYFLWIEYKSNGDLGAMRTLLEDGLPTGDVGRRSFYSIPYEERYHIAFTLYDVYVAGGNAAIANLIQKVEINLDTLNTLTPSLLDEWIDEAVNAD